MQHSDDNSNNKCDDYIFLKGTLDSKTKLCFLYFQLEDLKMFKDSFYEILLMNFYMFHSFETLTISNVVMFFIYFLLGNVPFIFVFRYNMGRFPNKLENKTWCNRQQEQ